MNDCKMNLYVYFCRQTLSKTETQANRNEEKHMGT